MTNLNIWYGSNENAEFSNLAKRRFFHDGYTYETVEHAYQTLKSGEFDARTYYKSWAPGKKFLGKRADRNTNIALMTRLIHESFKQNTEVLGNLTDIHPSIKITHNQDKGIWRTEFPRILEELRASS